MVSAQNCSSCLARLPTRRKSSQKAARHSGVRLARQRPAAGWNRRLLGCGGKLEEGMAASR